MVDVEGVVRLLESLGSEENVRGMARFGIVSSCRVLGVPKPVLRELAKRIGRNHVLAVELWETHVHEARILACLIADPDEVTEELLDEWVEDIDNWDLCDQFVLNLVWKTRFAWVKAREWALRREEYVRRAGFALMTKLALSDKKTPDERFSEFFPLLVDGAKDPRRQVYKAVVWALKQIGKRSSFLKREVIRLVEEIGRLDLKSARYVAREVYKYLVS